MQILLLSVILWSCGMSRQGQGEEPPSQDQPERGSLNDKEESFSSFCQRNPEDPIIQEVLMKLYGDNSAIHCQRDQHPLGAIETLELRAKKVTSVRALRYLQNLYWLDLGENPLKDSEELSELTNMEKLWLDSTPLSHGKAMQNMAKLQWLDISDTTVKAIEPLKDAKALQRLNISRTQIADLHHIAGFSQLRWFNAQNAGFQDAQVFRFLTRLNYLNLRDNQILDLSPLAGLYELQELDLTGNPIMEAIPSEDQCPTTGELPIPLRKLCLSLRR